MILDIDPPSSGAHKTVRADWADNEETSSKLDLPQSSTPQVLENHERRNADLRYVFILEKGVEIPLTYDEPRTPKYENTTNPGGKDGVSRGRKDISRLETGLPKIQSPDEHPPRLVREPSPYAYTPKLARPKDKASSGENLLSPGLMGSSPKNAKPQTTHSEESSQDKKHERKSSGQTDHVATRSPLSRHQSGIESSGDHATRNGFESPVQATPYPVSSDESDLSPDEVPRSWMTRKYSQNSPDSPRKFTMPRSKDFAHRRGGGWKSLREPIFPPARAVAPPDATRSPVSTAFPSSPGLQRLRSATPNTWDKRHASPQRSPGNTPHPSPPVTPPGERYVCKADHHTSPSHTPPNSRPTSRTASPISLASSAETRGFTRMKSHHADSVDISSEPRSRKTSPLPSPAIEGASYISAPRIDVRESSPAGRARISSPNVDNPPVETSRHASLAPFVDHHPPKLQSPPTGGRRRTVSNVETRPTLSAGKPTIQPAVGSPQVPRSHSRPSIPNRAVSFGSPPPTLRPCPRPAPVANCTDWYTLAGSSSFDICPSCREAVFGAGFERLFTPKPPHPPGLRIRCGFGSPWLQMAWLLAVQNKRADADLIYAMAKTATDEPPCPGRGPTVGQWYRIVDGETGKQVSGFDVCPSCVRNVETIFPVLRGVFQKSRSRHPKQARACDLRSDSKRFHAYIDLLELTANQAQEFRRSPNPVRLIELAKRSMAVPECSRDDMLLDQRWHTMPQIGELTVCADCFGEVIRPAIEQGWPLAAHFSRTPHAVAAASVGVSCQLYSPRMRGILLDCCRRNDLGGLQRVAVQRYEAERELQRRHADVRKAAIGEEEKRERVRALIEEWKQWE